MIQEGNKLYVVTRGDLSLGQQAVQAMHAAVQFQHDYPQVAADWNKNSGYLCLLKVNSLEELKEVMENAFRNNLRCSVFHEPDLNNELTAIALEPG